MKWFSPRMHPLAKWLLGSSGLLLFGSGFAWWALHRWGGTEGEFGFEPHPWLPTLRNLHGSSSVLALVLFGILLVAHIPLGWKMKKKRLSGIALILIVLLLAVTGQILYYASQESWQATAGQIHFFAGCTLATIAVLHSIRWPRRRKRMPADPQEPPDC